MKDSSNTTEKLYDLLHTLGKKWSIELMQLVKKWSKSYTQLQKELGINSKLVSTKVKELIELRILKKEWDKYDLSKLGKKVFKKIKPLAKVVVDFANELKDDFSEGAKKNHVAKKVSTLKKVITKKPAANLAKKVSQVVNSKAPVKKAVALVKKEVTKVAAKAKTPVKKVITTAKAAVAKTNTAVKKAAAKIAPLKKVTVPLKKVTVNKTAVKKITKKK